uniref:RING-type E3 ubiquitin transferase n=1 Tax=Meloidogyne hapla TaxID=6305 RepID=A0A1I8BGU2_MELHA
MNKAHCEVDINSDLNSYNKEISNYDKIRSPHKQLVNSGGLKVPVLVRKLGPSLTCPICLDLLRNTTVTSPTKNEDLIELQNNDNIDDFSSSENDFPSNDEKENDFSSSDDDELLNDFDKSSFLSSSESENENTKTFQNKRQKLFEEEKENILKNKLKENIKLLPQMDIYLKEYINNTSSLGNVTIYLKPLLINSSSNDLQYYRVQLPHLATGKFKKYFFSQTFINDNLCPTGECLNFTKTFR